MEQTLQLLFKEKKNHYKIPDYPIHQDIINSLKPKHAKWIINIKGGMGSGKTTEACKIAESLGKPIELITMKQDSTDLELYDRLKIIRHDVSDKQVSPIIKHIKEEKNKTLICDDWETVAQLRRKREAVTKKGFINELRTRNIHLILIWHNQKIPKHLMERPTSILVLKECNIKETGINQYLKCRVTA